MLNVKKIHLFLASIIPLALFLLLGHKGDIVYYLENNDSSFRNGVMFYIFRTLNVLNSSLFYIIFLYSLSAFLILKTALKTIPKELTFYSLILSPFLFFPSKENVSLVFLFLSLKFSSENRRFRSLLLLITAIALRPFYFPLLILFFKKAKAIHIILILFLIFIFYCWMPQYALRLDFTEILQTFIGYSKGYFESAINAGTTDFLFLNDLEEKKILKIIFEMYYRIIFPFWILFLPGISKYLYLFLYLFIAYFTLKVLSSNFSLKKGVLRNILYLLFGLFGTLPLVTINAGSAIRYLSLLPFFVHSINQLTRKKDDIYQNAKTKI